jgi:hypothetical protein
MAPPHEVLLMYVNNAVQQGAIMVAEERERITRTEADVMSE